MCSFIATSVLSHLICSQSRRPKHMLDLFRTRPSEDTIPTTRLAHPSIHPYPRLPHCDTNELTLQREMSKNTIIISLLDIPRGSVYPSVLYILCLYGIGNSTYPLFVYPSVLYILCLYGIGNPIYLHFYPMFV